MIVSCQLGSIKDSGVFFILLAFSSIKLASSAAEIPDKFVLNGKGLFEKYLSLNL
jgi:hypothetical protein